MSGETNGTPKALIEIPDLVVCCPLCGVTFADPVSANVKLTCPKDGGCGEEFQVRVKPKNKG